MKKSNKISAAKLGKLLSNVKKQIDLLQETGIFPQECIRACDSCINAYTIMRDRIVFKCELCGKKFPIRKNTVLEGSNLSNRRWIMLTYSFVKMNWTYDDGK